jgi:hypothetical protein
MSGRFGYPLFSIAVADVLSSIWDPKLASETVMDMYPGLAGIDVCPDVE